MLLALSAALILIAAAPARADITSWMTGVAPFAGGGSLIATDTSGRVYTYDLWSGMVKEYSGTGTFLGTVGPRTAGLLALAASPDGGVYVASPNAPNPGSTITDYDAAGAVSRTISVAQTGISGFGADDEGNVYILHILDTTTGRVEVFHSDGSYSQWTAQFDFFNHVGALGVAPDGTVYVSDYTNRIYEFTSTGEFVTAWGSTGLGLGQFVSIASIAVDSDGNVYTADPSPRWTGPSTANGPLIQKFDSSGNYLGSAIQGVLGLTTSGDDLVYGINGDIVYRIELTIPSVSMFMSPSIYVSQPLTATATASVPFGSITRYRFDFGAGGPAVAGPSATATNTYMTAGTYRVTVTVTGSRGGTATASVPVVVNPRSPANASPPSISGTAVEGRLLTEIHGTWNWGPVGAYGYQWVRCNRFGGRCTPIARASAQTYLLRPADVGHRIRVRETASAVGVSAGSGQFTASAPTAVVTPLPKLSALSISPSAFRAAGSGTKVTYRLVSAARVRFTIQRVAAGAHRFVTLRGGFTVTGRAGKNSVRFSGRLNGYALAPGNYRLVATPTAGGATGTAQTARLTILR